MLSSSTRVRRRHPQDAIGDPVPRADLDARRNDPKAMMDFLRKETYDLFSTPMARTTGQEFETRYRVRDGSRNLR